MLSEEQIQRLTKIAVDELDYDENEAEKEIRLGTNLANSVHNFLTLIGYGKLLEKSFFDGRFFEEIYRRQLRVLKEIVEIKKMTKDKLENEESIAEEQSQV